MPPRMKVSLTSLYGITTNSTSDHLLCTLASSSSSASSWVASVLICSMGMRVEAWEGE